MLTKLEKRILGLIQEPLKVCRRPFLTVARKAGCTPGQCLKIIAQLKAAGYIRRFSVTVNYSVLGRTAALVAASVPPEKLDKVITAVNLLEGVSHHYLRKHTFNLWFTLQDKSSRKIQNTLHQLAQKTGSRFYSLPAVSVFKLDARFSPQGPSQKDFKAGRFLPPETVPVKVSLTATERKVLSVLQDEFPIVDRPFDVLAAKSGIGNFMEMTLGLISKKAFRRISAVAAYRRLGYKANVMACFAVPSEEIEAAAEWLSQRPAVSHCYQRKIFPGWPYNLFAMMHGGRMGDLRAFATAAARRFGIAEWVLLPTQKELKKKPVMIY